MEHIQKNVKTRGFVDANGKVNTTALNILSGANTKKFVYALSHYILSNDEHESLNDIYEHLQFLYDAGNDDEAVRFINIMLSVMELEWSEDVDLVLESDETKHDYLYEFIEDFREIVEDYKYEAESQIHDDDDDNGEYDEYSAYIM